MLGIICALEKEAEAIKEKLKIERTTIIGKFEFFIGRHQNIRFVCCVCGVGKVNAAMCTQMLIDYFPISSMISTGVAGSLVDKATIGDIVVACDCVQYDSDFKAMGDDPGTIWFKDESIVSIPVDDIIRHQLVRATVQNGIRAVGGRFATGDSFISSPYRREQIASEFQATACDMESGAIGQVCYFHRIPFAAIRCVSDDMKNSTSTDYEDFVGVAAEKNAQVIATFLFEHEGKI